MFDVSMWEVGFGVAVSAVTCGVLFGLRWFFRPANPGSLSGVRFEEVVSV